MLRAKMGHFAIDDATDDEEPSYAVKAELISSASSSTLSAAKSYLPSPKSKNLSAVKSGLSSPMSQRLSASKSQILSLHGPETKIDPHAAVRDKKALSSALYRLRQTDQYQAAPVWKRKELEAATRAKCNATRILNDTHATTRGSTPGSTAGVKKRGRPPGSSSGRGSHVSPSGGVAKMKKSMTGRPWKARAVECAVSSDTVESLDNFGEEEEVEEREWRTDLFGYGTGVDPAGRRPKSCTGIFHPRVTLDEHWMVLEQS